MLLFEDPSESIPGGLSQVWFVLSRFLRTRSSCTGCLYVGVGWHTDSSAKLLQLDEGSRAILWSHGLGALAFYSSKPLLSLLRALNRIPQLIACVKILLRCSCLIVAYSRASVFDTRSLDEVLARFLRIPVRVIPNPIDTFCWYPAPAFNGKRVIDSEYFPNCTSIGRAEWQKGHQFAIQIASLAQESVDIEIMAPFATEYVRTLKAKAIKYGIASQTRFYIGLSADQRREKLQQSSCHICWSETEYQSLAILESLACGCPVVARPRGWLRNRSIPGVLTAHSLQEAAQLVDAIIGDHTLRRELGMAGWQYIQSNHSLPVITAKWLQLEEDILGNA